MPVVYTEKGKWSQWYRHADNPLLLERVKLRGRWIHWHTAPVDEPNPDGNYVHAKAIHDPSIETYPDEEAQFCGVSIDGNSYPTRKAFVNKMRGIEKTPVRYTFGMRVADALRWIDVFLISRRAKGRKVVEAAKALARLNARAAALPHDTEFDLITLFSSGFIKVGATGQTITKVIAEVENVVDRAFRVVVKPGTYFVSSGSHQNMVTRSEYRFPIAALASTTMDISATCINASRAVPNARDRFSGVALVSNDVARFLEAAKDASPMAIQAGVWALTDGYTAHQVQTHLVSRDQSGRTRQAVSDDDIQKARRILNSLGIRHSL